MQAGSELEKFIEVDGNYDRIYVIGDIHGCLPETETLLSHLEKKEKVSRTDLIVFIGDYIDRGENSKEVIDLLIEFRKNNREAYFLRGNHEDMLLHYLGCEEVSGVGADYLANGGAATLKSYGYTSRKKPENVANEMPKSHLSFLLNLDRYIIHPQYVFVHAGLNPLRDLRAQLDKDIFWIRDEFISNVHYFDRIVLFGHTPYEEVMFHIPYKIGIDTGLVYGNKLTCIELNEQRLIQVEAGSSKVKTRKFKLESPLKTE
ncbi:MAG: serine/threonine protein phosphatase [Candidatus Dadabacteria bacterium]|nr:MAG: serine/threonine protein phosphatase [Candidatus Dadabacteria bacterium]